MAYIKVAEEHPELAERASTLVAAANQVFNPYCICRSSPNGLLPWAAWGLCWVTDIFSTCGSLS